MGDVESARVDLDEFRATQDEFTEFFGDVFDQLQCLSLELFARHKCLEVSAGQKLESEETLAGFREDLLRLMQELQQLHGRLQADQQETQQSWGEIRAGYQRFLDDHTELGEIRDSFRQIADEFSGIKEDVQRERKDLHELCASVESQLSRLSSLTAELGEAQAQPIHDSQVADILEHARQQQAEWLQQRATLETELDAMRRRAAEQAESLSEQKRLAGQQQAELSGELKRMRNLMESLASQVRGAPAAAGESPKPQPGDSSVLSSVLAQFEVLQRDIAFRRNKRNNEPDPGGKTSPGS
jgi:DNA repair exonuclease SbcCD ATPase subunit